MRRHGSLQQTGPEGERTLGEVTAGASIEPTGEPIPRYRAQQPAGIIQRAAFHDPGEDHFVWQRGALVWIVFPEQPRDGGEVDHGCEDTDGDRQGKSAGCGDIDPGAITACCCRP